MPQLVEVVREIGDVSGATFAVGAARARDPAARCASSRRSFRPRWSSSSPRSWPRRRSTSARTASPSSATIPAGLPELQVPTPSWDDVVTLRPAAAGLFLVCFADEVLTARSFAGRHGQHIRVDQELLAMGVANAAAGVTQGLPVGASGSRRPSTTRWARAARSPACSPPAADRARPAVPHRPDRRPAQGGARRGDRRGARVGLVDPAAWRELLATDRVELAIAGVTTAGVIVTGVLEAIVFAVGLSIVDVVRRSARPHDAVLGWVDALGRWADVAVHRSARGRRRASSSTGSTTACSSRTQLRQGPRARGAARRADRAARARARRRGDDARRQRRPRCAGRPRDEPRRRRHRARRRAHEGHVFDGPRRRRHRRADRPQHFHPTVRAAASAVTRAGEAPSTRRRRRRPWQSTTPRRRP